MHNLSRVIVSLVYYNSLIRDTLEYTLNRESYSIEYYDYKRNGIVNEPLLNTPLKSFLDRNGEKGQELAKRLKEFGDEFYSDESTVIKKAQDGLRVDHAQHVKIFEAVIPLREELNSIVRLHLNYAHEHKADLNVPDSDLMRLDALVAADERFYRAVSFLAIGGEIFRQFDDYNKARRDANGEKTPASNFIEQDLQSLYRAANTVRQAATCNDQIYTDALDALFNSIEMMTGKRQLPTGKNFGDVINDVNAKISAFVSDAEPKFRDAYQPMLTELMEDTKRIQEERQAQEAEGTKAE